jgi:hypothetical protein
VEEVGTGMGHRLELRPLSMDTLFTVHLSMDTLFTVHDRKSEICLEKMIFPLELALDLNGVSIAGMTCVTYLHELLGVQPSEFGALYTSSAIHISQALQMYFTLSGIFHHTT